MPNLMAGNPIDPGSKEPAAFIPLEKLAQELAYQQQTVYLERTTRPLLRWLPVQEQLLLQCHRAYTDAGQRGLAFSSAAEWMLDNFYIVQQVMRQVEKDFTPAYYDDLPTLASQNNAGLPRIFTLTRRFVRHEQCQVSGERLHTFLRAYQAITPLTMGEMWALPIMLRICLLAALAQANGRLTQLAPSPETIPEALRFPLQIEDKDVVAHCIVSLRWVGNTNWQTFFEEANAAEQILRQDPSRLYSRMTFDTRDQYRKVVETMARQGNLAENVVAQTAVSLAQSQAPPAAQRPDDPWNGLTLLPQAHVGYYLIGEGRGELEQELGYHPGGRARFSHWLKRHALAAYLSSALLLILLLLALLLAYTMRVGGAGWQLVLVALVAFMPITAVAINLLNWFTTQQVTPQRLPKLNFEQGIPASCQSMIVIPAMLTDEAETRSLLEQLERHYLRNPDPQIGFALLTDFTDAPEPDMPGDAALCQQAQEGIQALNQRYDERPFYLFHRRRQHNPNEGVWMGWERKRGKLHEFNHLLRGDMATSYTIQQGQLERLPGVQFVITLDADTILPTDAAQRLVGTLAHPLNRAHCNPVTGRVESGYTILQPRTEIQSVSANQSLFTRIFSGDVGLDLYTLAVSDVYQDLFGEGIFVGKGIYDVDAFTCSVAQRIPENSLLSHDLFEGVQGRTALVTDIVLYEEYPPHYLAYVRRAHRWIRGDWQLLPWLWRMVPAENGRLANELSSLSRWKIIDNLRRSLVAPFLFLFFIVSWLLLPGSPAVWTLIGLFLSVAALLAVVLSALKGIFSDGSWRQNTKALRHSAVRWLLQIAFLPYEALLNLDAIVTTLGRLFITRRHLLQWTTAARTARLFGSDRSAETITRQMIRPAILVALITVLLIALRPQALPAAVPVMIVWVLAPEIAYRISLPTKTETAVLTPLEQQRLRNLARRTWLFYEEYVGPTDHWLPPDHFQEAPRGETAHRTSPTNIGLYLLSALSAYDFGYISLLNLSLRINDTFDTLSHLTRYRGHFLNWIDTETLTHLNPRYVSTVDSGNLAGCLLALKQACLAMKEESVWRSERWQGLLDTLSLVNEGVASLSNLPQMAHVEEWVFQMQNAIQSRPSQAQAQVRLLNTLSKEVLPELEHALLLLFTEEAEHLTSEMVRHWQVSVAQLRHNLGGMRREIELLLPWLLFIDDAPSALSSSDASPAVQAAWQGVQATLPVDTRLGELADSYRQLETAVSHLEATLDLDQTTAVSWCREFCAALVSARLTANTILASFNMLAQKADRFVQEMDFTFLYNPQRHVSHIGYNLENGRLDDNYYDLLASEARIASLVAIAKRDVPQKHWLHLARPLTQLPTGLALLSWSGTMFEYLMPPLLMNSFPGTLLAQSCRAIVDYQIEYGRRHNMPWGISESGFYTFDNALNYQYRAFGVPGAGFKRGLSEDRVITPYASLMALSIDPKAVVQNLDHLLQYQMMGMYGLYEALDFTPSRLEMGQEAAVVQSYMAHHQGMIMLALLNYLQADKMVRRFHAEPTVQSVELLLQEQIPVAPSLQNPHEDETKATEAAPHNAISADPWSIPTDTPLPLVHYLANGRFGSLLTNAGGGMAQTSDMLLTRWRPDSTQDDWGLWLYLQDTENGVLWSATPQPLGGSGQVSSVQYFPHMVQFNTHQNDITVQTAVTVAPTDNVEIRRLHLTNQSDQPRHLRLTSYGEVSLADFATDNRHPAFAKLFVESDYLPAENALIFRRRPRAADEAPRYLGHMLVTAGDLKPTGAYESDRAAFLGRNRTTANPAALQPGGDWLRGTSGATLDPVMALGQEITLPAHSSSEVALLTFTAPNRADLLRVAQRYQKWSTIEAAFNEARALALQEMTRLDLDSSQLAQLQQMLSLLLYPHAALRTDAATIAANELGQSALWGHGISGDYPILLLELHDEEAQELLTAVLRAHTYWRRLGLQLDVVLLNRQATNYGQPVQNFIRRTIRRLESEQWLNKRGGIFLVRGDQINEANDRLLRTVARVILSDKAGSLATQLAAISRTALALPPFHAALPADTYANALPPLPRPTGLLFDNGYGGFAENGREYVIYLQPGEATPAPWINVVANERVGFLASETGGGYTWAENSGENRLTTWRNDPVTDLPAEALYLRDEETGLVWSPTPQPVPADAPYLVRHGAGYTCYAHHSHGLKQSLRLFVSPEAPVKIVQLRLENSTERPRRLTATYYAEWVLGPSRNDTQMTTAPAYNRDVNALLAQNRYRTEFCEAVAFLSSSKTPHGMTTDRTEFIGRLGSLAQPAALTRIGLSDRVEAGVDPCAVLQMHVDLPPGGSETIYFLLGQGQDEAEALATIRRFRNVAGVEAAWEATHAFWDDILGTIQVETPDAALDILLNRWLLYQTLSCRIWGRSALYQSSGAYGFRDQLQDVMSVIHARPDVVRQQLLRAAQYQFEAGDVLHWWHPPSGRGVRTRITDDLVWLPFVAAYYVECTGETAVLDEQIPFLLGEPLAEDEEERYGHFETSAETASLYEHCCRALARAATKGWHGLPLMGAGDWNDGMNRVGIEGEGESIWLGWFLAAALQTFARLCRSRGDEARAAKFERQAEAYRQAIEAHGWDGAWYRRAYYDDGTPLGSQQNEECRIDAIPQSWGVLTGLADHKRVMQAMQAIEEQLVKEDDRLLLLFTPPFDKTDKDPGYIKGYLPGIRENGGQYTHAAIWSIWAFAELGQAEKAMALYHLLNPIYRADSRAKADKYKIEPYVISADVYAVSPHVGRGGWSWYTGSSGWMYRLGIEGILGLKREGDSLAIRPRIPADWAGFKLVYHYGHTTYRISVVRKVAAERKLLLDDEMLVGEAVPLVDDGGRHAVVMQLPLDRDV